MHILFLCVTDLHYHPKTIKNTLVSHNVALGDKFINYDKHTHTQSSYSDLITHTPSCCHKDALIPDSK